MPALEFKTDKGKDPNQWWLTVTRAAEIKPGDVALQYAGERQKTRILERTARGVDVDEVPFAPYSNKGPYYWYPSKGGGERTASPHGIGAKKRVGAAERAFKAIGAGTRTRLGIKFDSYAAFKASIGRSVVDLFGPRAPHMLQAIIVKVTGLDLTIGFYGEEAARAEGHNEGTRHLPRRHFFGASVGDLKKMEEDVMSFIRERVGKVF